METNEVFVTTDINNGELWANQINVSAIHWINQEVENGRSKFKFEFATVRHS